MAMQELIGIRPSEPPRPEPEGDVVALVRSVHPDAPRLPFWRILLTRSLTYARGYWFAPVGGGLGILTYLLAVPGQNRHFQPLPPWGDEAPILFGIFLAATASSCLIAVIWRKQRAASR